MAIKFQYNKTSLQQLEKQLKMRERSLPTIKSKESALRIEVIPLGWDKKLWPMPIHSCRFHVIPPYV